MKEFVWAAVYFCGGAVVSLGLYALIAGGAKKEREYDIYREGFAEGHRIGLRKGKALQRVDVAPGVDSIRPEKWAENETKEVPHD